MSAAPAKEAARPEPWLSTALRVLVHAITAGVIAFPLTMPEGVLAAVIGAAVGSLSARFLARSALRLPAILLGGLGALLAIGVLRFLVVDLSIVPELLGPAGALAFGDAVVFGLGALVVSLVLRTVSARRAWLTVIETALVAGGFATLLVGHRNGAIHRPYEIADPLITRGEDPTVGILIIGAAGAAVIGMLLLSERSAVRSVLHLAVVAGLLLLILVTTTMTGLPPPPSTGGALGLQDDDREARDRQAGQPGGEGQGRRRESGELEFLDEYPGGQPTPDAVIIFHDDYSSPSGYYYFRQNAFSQYNGRKLIAATGAGVDEDVHNTFPTSRSREVAWVPEASGDRAAVETTVAMIAENSAPLGLEAPTRLQPATNPNPQRFRRLYRVHSSALTTDYESLLGREVGDPSWDDDRREHYLRGPDDPRYRALAEHIVGQLPEELREDPIAKALAITQYLGEHGTYSLRSRHAGAEDPTADFLFGDLTGYCVHFSHAAVYLMRAAGVPARVGTGYAVAEANRQGGSGLLLRNTDQHAWPEVFVGASSVPPPPPLVALRAYAEARAANDLARLTAEERELALRAAQIVAVIQLSSPPEGEDAAEDEGDDGEDEGEEPIVEEGEDEAEVGDEDEEPSLPPWMIPIDASTPESSEEELRRIASSVGRAPDALLREAMAQLSPLEQGEGGAAGWVVMDVAPQNVLDPPGEPPDPQLQRLLAEMARGSEALEDAPQPPRPMAQLVRELGGPVLFALLWMVPSVLGLLYAAKIHRRVAPSFVASPRLVFRAALDALSDGGLRRAWGESHEAFARRVAREVPSLGELTRGHLSASFGRRADARELARMVRAAAALRAEVRAALPWWRLALGWINPFSWLLTR